MSGTGRSGGIITGPSPALVAIGGVPGWRTFTKFAQSDVVSTSQVDVWPNASILSYLTSAEQMNLASTDVNDDEGSTGAETLTIFGLDGNYDEIQENVTLDGTNNVLTTNSYLRVYRMVVTSAGSTGSNEGTITATAASSATVQAYIDVGVNQTLQSQYTVPNGYYLILQDFEITIQKGDQAQVTGVIRPLGEVFQTKRTYNIYQESARFEFNPPLLVSPKSDISVRATKISGAGNVDISCAYDGYLVESGLVNI